VTINVPRVTGGNAIMSFAAGGFESKGVTIPISELQTTVTSPFAINETNSKPGIVEAHLSYDGQTAFTSFQIIGNVLSSDTTQDHASSSMPTVTTGSILPVTQPIPQPTPQTIPQVISSPISLPEGTKISAERWSQGTIGDRDFSYSINDLMAKGIIKIPNETIAEKHILSWFRAVAGYWAENQISDDEYVKAIQYLVSNEFIKVS
jgi:hypothetical protein